MPTRLRVGPKTVDEMVDYYGITGPCREPLIRYLQVRSAGLNYASLWQPTLRWWFDRSIQPLGTLTNLSH